MYHPVVSQNIYTIPTEIRHQQQQGSQEPVEWKGGIENWNGVLEWVN